MAHATYATRVHAVDSTYELYRAHYSKRPRKVATVDGRDLDVTASVGLAASLLALLAEPSERVTHLVYAFDHTIRSSGTISTPAAKTTRGSRPASPRSSGWSSGSSRRSGCECSPSRSRQTTPSRR